MRLLLPAIAVVFWSLASVAQIAPECAGATLPVDYNDDQQRAFLQNYFAAATMMTPNGPWFLTDGNRAKIGLEAVYIPPLPCHRRLVQFGNVIKTENTNFMPVLPRPRLQFQLPNWGPVQVMAGLTLFPPIPFPFGTLMNAGGEVVLGWTSAFGLNVGLRGHLNINYIRGELATPVSPEAAAIDDIFWSATFGGDLGLAYRFPKKNASWLTPFFTLGYAGTRTLFLVGDDLAVVQNYKAPWSGVASAVGVEAITCERHCAVTLTSATAFGLLSTIKLSVSYIW